jgi:hypothetical protein
MNLLREKAGQKTSSLFKVRSLTRVEAF